MISSTSFKFNIMSMDDEILYRMQEYSPFILNEIMIENSILLCDGKSLGCILSYMPEEYEAPVITALTDDRYEMIMFIDVAQRNNIYWKVHPSATRIIYENLGAGEEIPKELYKAIAKEFAVADKMKNVRKKDDGKI